MCDSAAVGGFSALRTCGACGACSACSALGALGGRLMAIPTQLFDVPLQQGLRGGEGRGGEGRGGEGRGGGGEIHVYNVQASLV